MQAKGLKTGNLAEKQPVYIDMGLTNIEAKPMPEQEVPRTSEGLEDVEQEAFAEAESKPKQKSLKEKIHALEEKIRAGYEREQKKQAAKRAKNLREFTGEKEEESEEEQEGEETEEELEDRGAPATFGKILSDLFGDYNASDLSRLSKGQLEDLAVKFDSQSDGFLLKPSNPFKDELFKRIKAEEQMKMERQKLRAEMEPMRAEIRKEIAEIRGKRKKGEEKGLLSELFGG
jgi:hypothetical protein